MKIVKRDLKYLISYNDAITSVCKEGKYLSNSSGYPLERTEVSLKRKIDKDFPNFFAVTDYDTVVGWCDITPNPKDYFKHVGTLGMGIIKEYRGRGLGRELLEVTLDYAKKRDLEKVELEVYESNKRAISLYKKLGFLVEGIKRNSKKVNGVYEDIYIMGKMLNETIK